MKVVHSPTRMDWWLPVWCMIVMLSVTVRGFDCPRGRNCIQCHSHADGLYEMNCEASENEVFKVRIVPESYVKLFCPFGRTTNWTEFDLGTVRRVAGITVLYMNYCDLPMDGNKTTLSAIARQFLADDVRTLEFNSYKDITPQLTREQLRDFRGIANLSLENNGLTSLPADLLQDFDNLTLLNLLSNKLRRLPENFLRVPNLRALEIGLNEIDSLAVDTFARLEKLVLLNMWNNKLVEILPGTFDSLVSLESLDMRGNNLQSLPSGIFDRLAKLRVVALPRNNFTVDGLPADLFRNNSKLRTMSMFDTKRHMGTLPAGFLANLTNLRTVMLQRNGFTALPEDLFWGSTSLQTVTLERNLMTTLPRDIFRDARDLESLDLNFNDLESLPDGVFSSLRRLNKLDLSRNKLTSISKDLFSGLVSLRELNMERNNLTFIHYDAFLFMKKLQIAKFANNALTLRSNMEENISPFQYCDELIELHLAHNQIKDVFDDWRHTLASLKMLNLSYNNIPFLQSHQLQYLSARSNNHVTVDYSNNKIRVIDFRYATEWASGRSQPEWLKILIGNNPLRCDCSVYDLLRYLEGELNINVTNAFYLEIGETRCATPHDFRSVAVAELRSKTLTCSIKSEGMNAIYCPEKCDCFVRQYDKAILIDCAGRGLTEAPKKIETYPGHHVELILSNNHLTKMPNPDQPGYGNVTVLKLDHNDISSLSLNKLSANLKILKLNNNYLTKVDTEVIDFFKKSSSLSNLTLQANPWMCNCETRDFLSFIQAKRQVIPVLQEVQCHGETKPISEMTPEELCPVEIEWIIGGCLLVAFLGILVGSLAALYYRYQREVKVWLYARQWCLWFVTEDELDRDKLYDAFISYSHKDEEFVVNSLVPKLEEGPRPFKLCIHFRDWLAGEWIPKQIARSVEESRRTIVVLSPNFLESVWGRLEFRAAHSQALSEGRARVIVILYGDIGSTDDLDPELKAYLSMNTYVKWGDPWFWEKLKYALPHPPEFTKRNNRPMNIFANTQPSIRVSTDKSELIDTSGIPTTPPAASTPPADAVKLFVPDEDATRNESDKLSVKNMNAINSNISTTDSSSCGGDSNTTLTAVVVRRDTKNPNLQCTPV